MKRFYRLQACCSRLEPEEKPRVNAFHHNVWNFYQTLNHSYFTQETPLKMICTWQKDFYVTSNCTFSSMVLLSFSRLFFTHHVEPIIEEVESDIDAASDSLVVQVQDPPPSRVYVQLLEKELVKTKEAFSQALKDHAHAEKEAHKWYLNSDFFYKKATSQKPPHSPTPPSSPITLTSKSEDSANKFLGKLDEEAENKKGRKSKKLMLHII